MSPLAFSSALFGLTSLLLGICIPFFGNKTYHRLWVTLNYLVAWWGFGLVMIVLSGNDKESASFWWKAATAPGIFIAPIFCHFTMAFCGFKNRLFLFLIYLQALIFEIFYILDKIPYGLEYEYGSYFYVRVTSISHAMLSASWILCSMVGIGVLCSGLRASELSPEKKIQIKYLIFANLIGFGIGGSAHWLPAYGLHFNPAWNIAILGFVLLSSYALFRYELLRMDHAIRKGLVYTLLITLFTAAYFLTAALIGALFQSNRSSLPLTLITLAVIIIAAEPVRLWIQSFINSMLFKGSLTELAQERDRLFFEVSKNDRMKAIATLAAGMAHEIKNPLTTIKTFAEYLPERYDDPSFRKKFKRLVADEVDRVNHIVGQLLDFAKPNPPNLKSVVIQDIIDETLELLTNNFLQKKIKVQKQFASKEPVLGDKNQLRQVFLNLFLNSIAAMDEDGLLTVTITSSAQSNGHNQTIIRVRDNGRGIQKDDLPHIFEPFYTTNGDAGTGLGLSIVYGIIKEHGGKIQVLSELGKFTEFGIIL